MENIIKKANTLNLKQLDFVIDELIKIWLEKNKEERKEKLKYNEDIEYKVEEDMELERDNNFQRDNLI